MFSLTTECPDRSPCSSGRACPSAGGCGGREPAPRVAVATAGESRLGLLTAPDRDRYGRLRGESARRDFLAGRLAVRRALEARRAGGPASVSLAHRAGYGLAAAGPPEMRLGVDLEPRRAVGALECTYFAGAREIEASPDPDPTVLWMLKEAVWKMLALPRSLPFRALDVVAEKERELLWIRHGGRTRLAHYRLLQPWPAWWGAVAWLREERA
jgi:4'-phosphopantetheinyl transferase EntD